MSDADEMLTVEEAAAELKVDVVTVQRELKAQRLPGKKVGRAWRIRREDLRTYFRGQRRDPRQAIEHAELCFDSGDLDTGLATLIGALGYEELPHVLRFAMTRRVAALIDAAEKKMDEEDAGNLVDSTRWSADADDAFSITYIPTVPGVSPPWTVRLPQVWNKMIEEFKRALELRVETRESRLILWWRDNLGNEVDPPTDAEQVRRTIARVVPAGSFVVMVRYNNRWTVVKADAQRTYVGPGPYGPAYDDVTELVTRALAEAQRPREDYQVAQPPRVK
jgi:excisionase family DNA binding protein